MRDTPEGIIEELREIARIKARELGVAAETLTEWEAADLVQHLSEHLRRISTGEMPAREIAAEALDVRLWLLSD